MIEDLTLELLQAAWERVAWNSGGPGVDGVTVERFASQAPSELPELLLHAHTGAYRARPLRRIVVQKHPGSRDTRTLQVPTVRDRVLQTAVARILSRSFEEEFLESSYAYRPNRGVDRAVARILQLREFGYQSVVDADITSYFASVNHKLLLDGLCGRPEVDASLAALLKQWVHAVEWDGREIQAMKRGIAQGSPISPLFANLFLTPLDVALARGDHKLIRYADDILILCKGPTEAEEALQLAGEALTGLGLSLKPEKTRVASFDEGFQFLGVRFQHGEPMIPWKWHPRESRVIFMAHFMSPKQLRPYRDETEAVVPSGESPQAAPPHPSKPLLQKAVEVDMPYLYLTQPGSILRKSGDRFLVELDGEIALDLPYHRLEHILIFGNIQVTSQALAEALDHNIAFSLFSRQGRFRGGLTPPPGQNVTLRLRQYALHQDAVRSVAAARETIRWKMENSLSVLERYEGRGSLPPDAGNTLSADMEAIEDLQAQLDGCQTAAEILGHEGAAARSYFDGLSIFNRSTFKWTGRIKHPSPDPLNALLSLTYTLVTHELAALVVAHGLDPAIGFFHEIDGARPSLALDLLEPFRAPVADRLVWTLVNRQQLGPADFSRREGQDGVFLEPAALRRFFEAYEKWMLTPVGSRAQEKARTYRDLLRHEVEAFVEYLRSEGGSWSPFRDASIREESNASAGGV